MGVDTGLAKHQSKKIKAAGLQKLKFYCQICKKQCRDANGFKNHLNSPSHQGKICSLKEQGNKAVEDYSKQFIQDFIRLLRISHGTKKVNANKFYQEYIINDRNHIHMNSTRWRSLTQFVKYLGTNGLVRVEQDDVSVESELSLTIRYIDRLTDSNGKLKQKSREKESRDEEEINRSILERQMNAQTLSQTQDLKDTIDFPVLESSEIPKNAGPVRLSFKKTINKHRKKSAFDAFKDSEDDEIET